MATVLVVDDEADLRELVRLNLSLDGHRVLGAADGDEALDVAGQENPDIILLDIVMPRRDGWDTLGAIKADGGGLAEVPVLMLAARSDEVDQLKAAIEGAIKYITKPFSIDTLRTAVEQVLVAGPEPILRRQAQTDALRRLARLERRQATMTTVTTMTTMTAATGPQVAPGRAATPGPPTRQPERMATPRLTRLESTLPIARLARARERSVAPAGGLSSRQQELLDTVATTESVRQAAERLGVSRSYVYASVRRIATKVGIASGPKLIALARQGTLPEGRRSS
jgi:CheY-like chemotaxis protein/DNA-binding CsgD family transcriptional regulator